MSKKLKVIPCTSWSMSRKEHYDQCPLFMQLQDLQHVCPVCFKGEVKGGFDGKPKKCTVCKSIIEDAPPVARGIKIGEQTEAYLRGKRDKPPDEVTNPEVLAVMKSHRKLVMSPKGGALVEHQILLDKDWKPLTDKFDKRTWFRGKLDVLIGLGKPEQQVDDWKSGSVDSKTGKIKHYEFASPLEKYKKQLLLYGAAVVSAFPFVKRVLPRLIFTDVTKGSPFVKDKPIEAADVPKIRAQFEKEIGPMMKDTEFNPRPGFYCRWCPYEKGKGGPCRF